MGLSIAVRRHAAPARDTPVHDTPARDTPVMGLVDAAHRAVFGPPGTPPRDLTDAPTRVPTPPPVHGELGDISGRHSSFVHAPHLVDGLVRYPDLADALEAAIRRLSWRAYVPRGGTAVFEDDVISVSTTHVMIKDLASCDPAQLKVILAYFPRLHVGAYVGDPTDWRLPHVERALRTFVPRMWLGRDGPGGSIEVATYAAGDRAAQLAWDRVDG